MILAVIDIQIISEQGERYCGFAITPCHFRLSPSLLRYAPQRCPYYVLSYTRLSYVLEPGTLPSCGRC